MIRLAGKSVKFGGYGTAINIHNYHLEDMGLKREQALYEIAREAAGNAPWSFPLYISKILAFIVRVS